MTTHPVALERFSRARFVSAWGDNMSANAGSRNNASSARLASEVLRTQGAFVIQHGIVQRVSHVASAENISDPLSREKGDGAGLQEFFQRARGMGVNSFTRLALPDAIGELRTRVRKLWQLQQSEAPMLQPSVERADRRGRQRLAAMDDWTFVHPFCGVDSVLEATRPLGGRPAGACDLNFWVRKLWEHRTGLPCLGDFSVVLAMARSGELRDVWDLSRAMLYVSGAPCIDFSTAGCQRGVEGDTGMLFLQDVELALALDLTVVIKEIVPGILAPHLVGFLFEAVRLLARGGRYLVGWRQLRCRRHGDVLTFRERIFIVAVRRDALRQSVRSSDDLFPAEDPPAGGCLVSVLRPEPREQDTRGLDVSRVEWLPARRTADDYDGLRLLGRYEGSSEIGHHIYDAVRGIAATQRTGGTGPGLGTGLYWDGKTIRRLSPEEAFAVQSLDTSTVQTARELGIPELEIYAMAGNTIPVLTLRALIKHVLSLLQPQAWQLQRPRERPRE